MEKSETPYPFEYDSHKSYGDLEVIPGYVMEARRSHSGLQGDSQSEAGRGYGNLEVVPENGKEVVYNCDAPIWVSGPGRGFGRLEETTANNGLRKGSICGLQPPTFWILLVVIVLVIGGAVGGGIGGALAVRNRDGASPTSGSNTNPSTTLSSNTGTITATSLPITSSSLPIISSALPITSSASGTTTIATASTTSSAPVTSGTTGLAANPCPGQNLTTIQGSDDSIFTLLCSVDWPNGENSAYGNETVTDLSIPTTAYTLKECIADCIDFNTAAPDESPCRAVVYAANLTASFDGGQGGNCFLKNTVGRYFPSSDTSMAAGILGGGSF
ncbi:uncharacterized protein N7498_002614 [Penicillium cinerascens]|uniref:Apple domain-containing protein n=1 Tax=Penicillium cinerascens TaxID=70096 RepID=A0A9W9NAF8_9EURO|nr:uncharacterized protein N7498_002614 [Penicillium cinerascens]KAJ5216207.1 hypothetical protein N7498_002614 [Penicillium cinerascens]